MRRPLVLSVIAVLLVAPAAARAETLPFTAVDAVQYWDVPAGVTLATIDLYGSQGGGTGGGQGAHVRLPLPVTPGERLYLFVGGRGGAGAAGFNGGGRGGHGSQYPGFGGGGATDVRRGGTALANRLAVAAGGGGAGGGSGGPSLGEGGAGGASAQDAPGGVCTGRAATTSAGGTAGLPGCGNSGEPGVLGAGGEGQTLFAGCKEGGGGGGGLYGGGGGGGDCMFYDGTGGGGGSSLTVRGDLVVPPGALREDGVRSGEGAATITWTAAAAGAPPASAPPAAVAAPRDTVAPKLGALRLSRSAFAAAGSGASISAKRKKPPVGTRVSYSLTEAGRVTFSVQRKASGRRVGRSCAAPKRSNRTKPKCARWLGVRGTFAVTAKAGANTFSFRGRVGGKTLRAGSYRLVGVAVDAAGNRSPAVTKTFSIVR